MTEHEFEQVAAAREDRATEREEAVRQDDEAERTWDVEGSRLMVLEAIDNAARGLTDEGKLEITAALDALITVAAQSSEVAELRAAVKHWRSNHDIAVQRKRVKGGIIRDLRAALEDALMGLAIFGDDNHPGEEGEVTRAIDRGRRVLGHVREPLDG